MSAPSNSGGLAGIINGQVILAASQMDAAQIQQPAWLWYEGVVGSISLGRWPKGPSGRPPEGMAPYVRLDLVLPLLAAAPSAPPAPQQVAPSVPCGGCGAAGEGERCIGCLHDFSPPGSAPTPAPTLAESEALQALRYAAMGLDRIHTALMSTGPKQAAGEMVAHFLGHANTALATTAGGSNGGEQG